MRDRAKSKQERTRPVVKTTAHAVLKTVVITNRPEEALQERRCASILEAYDGEDRAKANEDGVARTRKRALRIQSEWRALRGDLERLGEVPSELDVFDKEQIDDALDAIVSRLDARARSRKRTAGNDSNAALRRALRRGRHMGLDYKFVAAVLFVAKRTKGEDDWDFWHDSVRKVDERMGEAPAPPKLDLVRVADALRVRGLTVQAPVRTVCAQADRKASKRSS